MAIVNVMEVVTATASVTEVVTVNATEVVMDPVRLNRRLESITRKNLHSKILS